MPTPRLLLLLLPLAFACGVNEARTLAPGATCDPDAPLRCEGPAAACLPLAGGAGICTHACLRNDECPGGLICKTGPSGTSARCEPGFLCESDTDCSAGHRCDADTGSCYIPVKRGLCSPCTADAQCPAGGSCVLMAGTAERYCTVSCDDCPSSGFECRNVPVGTSGPATQCMPTSQTCNAQRPLCAACDGDAQCGDGNDLCVTNHLSGERFCGLSCNPACEDGSCTSACPENFRCADLSGEGAGPFQCVPLTGSCAGWCAGDASCAPGQICDADEHVCVPAPDGRACASCRDDDDCAAGARCVTNQHADQSFCAPLCDRTRSCTRPAGPGFVCIEVESEFLCVPDGGACGGGPGRVGSACGQEGAAGCISGICLRDGDVGLCSARCTSDAACGDATFRCCAVVESDGAESWDCGSPLGAEGGVCAPRGGLFGDGCEPGRPPCQDGHCLDLGTSQLCTAACDKSVDCDVASGAPGDFVCRPASLGGSGELIDICFPSGGGEVGSDCTFGPAACSAQLCISKESGNVCTQTCSAASECPSGWSCGTTATVADKRVEVCLPPGLEG